MWISRKRFTELEKRAAELENRCRPLEINKMDANTRVVTLYADNEIYRQELQISLSPYDWCELQKQQFYQELMKYLDNLQTQRNRECPDGMKA